MSEPLTEDELAVMEAAATRQDVPRLLAEVRRLQAENERLSDGLSDISDATEIRLDDEWLLHYYDDWGWIIEKPNPDDDSDGYEFNICEDGQVGMPTDGDLAKTFSGIKEAKAYFEAWKGQANE